MQNEIFEKRYDAFEHDVMKNNVRHAGFAYTKKSVLFLLKLLIEDFESDRCLIPNVGMGELALCSQNADAYCPTFDVADMLEKAEYINGINIVRANFLNIDIIAKYSSILLFPTLGERTEHGRSEILYIKKSLKLLADNGRAVIIVPQNVLTAPAFSDLRKEIVDNYSLEAVFTLDRISPISGLDFSVLIVENHAQNEKIFMTLKGVASEDLYNCYKNGEKGFYVSSSEVYDRLDANYYNPEYKEIRELTQKRDTVKLGDMAEIYPGCMITSDDRKEFGDYVIVGPRQIRDNEVVFSKNDRVYCTKTYVESNIRAKRCILKKGDVLLSLARNNSWAIYMGEDDFAIANRSVYIIRAKQGYEGWLKLFFNTHVGIETLEAQLSFLSRGTFINHVSIMDMLNMYVPDIKMMKMAEQVNKAVDIDSKVSSLFKSLGWKVKEAFGNNRFRYDLALFEKNTLKGVVEIKEYKSSELVNNKKIAEQLRAYKNDLGDVAVYLFVDNEIFEYDDGRIEQLSELPRPGKKEKAKKTNYSNVDNNAITIEKRSYGEISLTDRWITELTLQYENINSRLERIEDKVDDINEKLELLSKQISGYQSLVDRQLKLAVTPEEEERIISAFSEECTERIIDGVATKYSEREYNIELNGLVRAFGEKTWNKMEESSRTFLVSSKVIYKKLLELQDIVDYSGVCLLVTKALEVEMGKRFCKNFIAYLKNKYPGRANYSQYPSALLNQYGKPDKSHFTLGSVAYVLCYLEASNLTDEQKNNNRTKLIEYSKEKLLSGKTDEEILDLLGDFAESVEEVRKDYRNPSAHINELSKVDAEECFDLVIDVEKLLKRIIDSFDE